MKFPKVITVACEKGGVGKTTIATNLAVYLKAMREDIPVTILSFDNHFTVDRMFSLEKKRHEKSVKDIFVESKIIDLVEFGQYGVGFVPSARRLEVLPENMGKYDLLLSLLSESNIDGVIIIDTRPVLDYFTISALLASDTVIIPVKDLPSLNNLKGITDLFEEENVDAPEIKLLPSIVDGMVKFRNNTITMDRFLRSVASERGHELFDSSIPKSPKVESLTTNLTFEVYPIINYARNTSAHKGFKSVTKEILHILDDKKEPKSLTTYRKKYFDNDGGGKKYRRHMESVLPYCPLCAEEISAKSLYIKPDMLYYESGRRNKGFLDINCLTQNLLFNIPETSGNIKSMKSILLKNIDQDATICINVSSLENGRFYLIISLHDENGEHIETGYADYDPDSDTAANLLKITETTPLGPAPCLIKLGGRPMPDSIFLDNNYHAHQDRKIKILLDSSKIVSSLEL